eukprot:Em0001g341a
MVVGLALVGAAVGLALAGAALLLMVGLALAGAALLLVVGLALAGAALLLVVGLALAGAALLLVVGLALAGAALLLVVGLALAGQRCCWCELATLICTFPFQRAHGDLIPVLYLLCHYTPTIEVYWNGSMLFCVSVRIIKEADVRSDHICVGVKRKKHDSLMQVQRIKAAKTHQAKSTIRTEYGLYKYSLRAKIPQLSQQQRAELSARISAFQTSGHIGKISTDVAKHYKSFVGRDFKALAQMALFVLSPYLSAAELEVWIAVSKHSSSIKCSLDLIKLSIAEVGEVTLNSLDPSFTVLLPHGLDRDQQVTSGSAIVGSDGLLINICDFIQHKSQANITEIGLLVACFQVNVATFCVVRHMEPVLTPEGAPVLNEFECPLMTRTNILRFIPSEDVNEDISFFGTPM